MRNSFAYIIVAVGAFGGPALFTLAQGGLSNNAR